MQVKNLAKNCLLHRILIHSNPNIPALIIHKKVASLLEKMKVYKTHQINLKTAAN